MLNVLLKKQLLETMVFLFRRKGNPRRTITGYILLLLAVIILFSFLSSALSIYLGESLTELESGWLYFSLIGMIATAVGVFSSIFMTYSSLYEAKDNELLLSMPIRPGYILLVRMFGIYLIALIFEALVLIPAFIIHALTASAHIGFFLSALIILLLLPLLALTLSCILSWLIALFALKVQHAGVVPFAISLLFVAFCCYCFVQIETLLTMILQHSAVISQNIRIILYPIYHMGHGAEGSLTSLLIFSGITLAAFLVVYLLISWSFQSLTTNKRAARRSKYDQSALKSTQIPQTLLLKEFQRFSSSSTYMLNCSLGSILLLLAAVLTLIYRHDIRAIMEPLSHGHHDPSPLIGAAAVALLASLNIISAPSINLEGTTLWLIQTLPVSGWNILKSKVQLHWIITAIPGILCSLAVSFALRSSLLFTLLSATFVGVYIMMTGVLGLMFNLLLPNFRWATESVAVKHSVSVILSLLFNWLILALCGGMYHLMASNTHFEEILLFWAIGVWFVAHQIMHWLRTNGARILKTM